MQSFERTGQGNRLTHYAAEIAPLHWLLTKRRKSRIFQAHNCPDMSVPGIIRQVFEDAGIADDHFRFSLEREHSPREFVVAYRESDWDFVSRLMESEGISYFFEHTDGGHTMVIGDGAAAHVPMSDGTEFPFRDPNSLVEETEYAFEARDGEQIQVAAVSLDDYNFQRPGSQLRSGVAAERDTALEFSDSPGGFSDRSAGESYAQLRL